MSHQSCNAIRHNYACSCITLVVADIVNKAIPTIAHSNTEFDKKILDTFILDLYSYVQSECRKMQLRFVHNYILCRRTFVFRNYVDNFHLLFYYGSMLNLQATKLFIETPATKGGGGYHPPLDFVLGSRYCIV